MATQAASIKVCPSILNADLAALGAVCERLLDCGADWLHLDVMDNAFVPNLTFGAPVVASLRRALPPTAFLDVHAMVERPRSLVASMAAAGASQLTAHVEALEGEGDVAAFVAETRATGMRVGLSVKPATPVDRLLPFIADIDNALIMTVEPGFGGQSFMGEMMEKVRRLRAAGGVGLDVQVDGGVTAATAAVCGAAGANAAVAGTAIVNAPDRRLAIQLIRQALATES